MAEQLWTEERLAEAKAEAERQFKKNGVLIDTTLGKLGVPMDEYHRYVRRENKSGLKITKSTEKRGGGHPRYTTEQFKGIYNDIQDYRRTEGLNIKDAIKKHPSGIAEATYYRQVAKMSAHKKEARAQAKADAAEIAKSAQTAAPHAQQSNTHISTLENENRLLRNIVIDRDLQVEHLKMLLRVHDIEPT